MLQEINDDETDFINRPLYYKYKFSQNLCVRLAYNYWYDFGNLVKLKLTMYILSKDIRFD